MVLGKIELLIVTRAWNSIHRVGIIHQRPRTHVNRMDTRLSSNSSPETTNFLKSEKGWACSSNNLAMVTFQKGFRLRFWSWGLLSAHSKVLLICRYININKHKSLSLKAHDANNVWTETNSISIVALSSVFNRNIWLLRLRWFLNYISCIRGKRFLTAIILSLSCKKIMPLVKSTSKMDLFHSPFCTEPPRSTSILSILKQNTSTHQTCWFHRWVGESVRLCNCCSL